MEHKDFTEVAFYIDHKNLLDTAVAIADRWAQKGRSEAQAGKHPRNLDDFISWTNRLAEDQNGDIDLAELMYKCYMEGYNAGKAVA